MSKQSEMTNKMMKTLRIGSVLTALVVCGALVYPAVFAADSNAPVAEAGGLISAIEQFRQAHGGNAKDDGTQESPLVRQAAAFANYLDPPPPPRPVRAPVKGRPGAFGTTEGFAEPVIEKKPILINVRFKVIATSHYPKRPEKSFALIQEVGKGTFRWVKPGEKIGHLQVDEIKDGSMVVSNGKDLQEVGPERLPKVNLLKIPKGAKPTPDKKLNTFITAQVEIPVEQIVGDEEVAIGGKTPAAGRPAATVPVRTAAPAMSEAERKAALKDMFSELMEMQSGNESESKSSESDKGMRITDSEAKDLKGLGTNLNGQTPERVGISNKVDRGDSEP
jgi:hypothetical protein